VSAWDPVVVFRAKGTGPLASGAEWKANLYTTAPDEVLEVFRIEVRPPVDTATGTIKKLKYVTLTIDGEEFSTIRINSVMAPPESPDYPGVAVDLGVPYLHRPITGRIPAAWEATCIKVPRGKTLGVKVVAEDSLADTNTWEVVVKAARVVGASKLLEVVGAPVIDASVTLDADMYAKRPVPVSLETWDELPGGLKQEKPQILPWITYARNAKATTPNQWYDFDYMTGGVAESWMNLSWNLVDKSEAYLVKAIGVIPHANSKALRLFVSGRATLPEYPIEPPPGINYFYPAMYYDTAMNDKVKRAGPVFLKKPFLFHGVKGGIQVIDTGTSMLANGVEVHVYGVKFVLR
jgi:hypothetical protein